MLDKNSHGKMREVKGRVRALPREYQIAFYEISKYLYQFTTSDAGVVNMQFDILDMFEAGVQNGQDVLDIVGNDIIGFCDGLLGAIPEHTWINKMKSALNQSIHKKLGKRKGGGI